MPNGKKQISNFGNETKQHVIPEADREYLKKIASTAKQMRIATGFSYEEFALKAGINRNSYFRFEKSSQTGDNYTVALLLKVIRGLSKSTSDFFESIK
jgi:transcriptional regulator with XRE-family HTH domain